MNDAGRGVTLHAENVEHPLQPLEIKARRDVRVRRMGDHDFWHPC
jgi:hypothetical protein